jgi:hypothetical protein
MAIIVMGDCAILRLISDLLVIILGAPERDHLGGLISTPRSRYTRDGEGEGKGARKESC